MSHSSDSTLSHYESQLASVNELLKYNTNQARKDLLDLKAKLVEVIALLKGEETAKSEEIDFSDNETDDEFLKFQKEIKELDNESETSGNQESNPHEELCQLLHSLEGNKCRAPFLSPWGQRGYHNGIVFATELPDDCEDIKNVMVKVMFSNPICDEMKPCPYFLDGYCKFKDEKCRYSHGTVVQYTDLEEYIIPDYNLLERDSHCLVRCDDSTGLWQAAIVENCLDYQQYVVKVTSTAISHTLDAKNVLPLGNGCNVDEDESSDSSEECFDPNDYHSTTSNEVNYVTEIGSSPLGSWEKHTNGIGSKLMAKMGYVWGQGLGKNSDGRIEPIEAVVLPKGKSLDRCIELRENKGPETVENRFNSEQVKEEQRVKKIQQMTDENKSSVFDFLNKNILSKNHDESKGRKRSNDGASTNSTSKSSNLDLNFEMYSVGEEISKTRKEINRLHQSLKRNSERNEATCSHIKEKMAVQTNLLQQLISKEKKINSEINMKKGHKKITIF